MSELSEIIESLENKMFYVNFYVFKFVLNCAL